MHARNSRTLVLLSVLALSLTGWLCQLDAQLESVPTDAKTLFEERLAKDKFFSKIDLDLDARFAPLHVYVQPPKKRDAKYLPRIAEDLNGLLRTLKTQFLRELGDDLPPSRVSGFMPIIVLASPEDYDQWRKTTSGRPLWVLRSEAGFGLKLGAGVVFESAFTETNKRACSDWDRLIALTLGLMHERIDPKKSLLYDWLAQGFCDRTANLAWLHSIAEAEKKDANTVRASVPSLGAEVVQYYAAKLAKVPEREVVLHPFRDLASIRSYSRMRSLLIRKHRNLVLTPRLESHAQWAFMYQTRLVVHFLSEVHPAALKLHLGDWFRGEPAGQSFAKRFRKPDELDKEFRAWLTRAIKACDPKSKFDLDAKVVAPKTTSADPAAAAPPQQEEGPEFYALRLTDPTNAELVGLAFLSLERGRTAEALEHFDAIVPVDDTEREWIARERERVQVWRATRDAFVATLAERGTKLRLEGAGKRTQARVVKVSDGLLHFERNKTRIVEVPVDDFDPRLLARAIPKAERSWVTALPEMWANDPRMKRALRGDGPELLALREDVERFYTKVNLVRPALGAFQAIMRLPKSTDPKRLAEQLKFARERIAEHVSGAVFKPRRAELEHWVRAQYTLILTESPVEELVHGEVQLLGDDRIAVTYDFSDDAQLEDFATDDQAGEVMHRRTKRLKSPPAQRFNINNGALYLLGQSSYTHVLMLGSPVSFGSTLTYIQHADVNESFSILQGFALPNSGRGLWMESFHAFESTIPGATGGASSPPTSMTNGLPYVLRVEQQDGKLVGRTNGETVATIRCAVDFMARFAILPHTAWGAQIDELRIEGQFGAAERAVTIRGLAQQHAFTFLKGLE